MFFMVLKKIRKHVHGALGYDFFKSLSSLKVFVSDNYLKSQ